MFRRNERIEIFVATYWRLRYLMFLFMENWNILRASWTYSYAVTWY